MIPKSYVKVTDAEMGRKLLALIEALDDHDDVNSVYTNFDMPDTLLAELAK